MIGGRGYQFPMRTLHHADTKAIISRCLALLSVVRTFSCKVAPSRCSFPSSNQGFQDLEVRRKLARAYWRFAPALR